MTYITDNFSELVLEFSDPASRTRRRLRPVFADALEAMSTVMVQADAFWDENSLPEVEAQWRAELQGFLDRGFQIYLAELVPTGVEPADLDNWGSLDPDAPALKSYAGLVAGRPADHPDGLGAAPVPDAALPSVLASQIEILGSFDNLFGKTWWDKLIERVRAAPWPDPSAITKPLASGVGWIVGALAIAVGLAAFTYLRK